MNNILAISAGLKWSSLALKNENGVREANFENDTPTFLVSNIKKFLLKNGLELKELGGVITCSGPGSFTAIRTTLSAAKCLKIALNIPVISVNIFDVLGKKYSSKIANKNVLLVLKSEMKGEVYAKKASSSSAYYLNINNIDFDKEYDFIISDFLIKFEDKKAECICDEQIRQSSNFLVFERELVDEEEAYPIDSFYVKPPYVGI